MPEAYHERGQEGSSARGQSVPALDCRRLVFVGGLHRSGTTLLGRILADHPDFSGFTGTDAIEDEGQHLQTAYLPARKHGGPGRFARPSAAHLTEVPENVASQLGAQLIRDWSPYWDFEKRFLVEKSPPNMIMGRYLQSIFPGSSLIVIMRHPVVVGLATKKWTRRTSLVSLVDHWFWAHRLLTADAQHLSRVLLLRYEDLMSNPMGTMLDVQNFLGVDRAFSTERLSPTRSEQYLAAWAAMSKGNFVNRRRRTVIERRFAAEAHMYGYRIDDPSTTDPWKLEGLGHVAEPPGKMS